MACRDHASRIAAMPTTHSNAGEILRRVPLFADLSEIELQFLAERAVPRHYGPGELVFSEETTARGCS